MDGYELEDLKDEGFKGCGVQGVRGCGVKILRLRRVSRVHLFIHSFFLV